MLQSLESGRHGSAAAELASLKTPPPRAAPHGYSPPYQLHTSGQGCRSPKRTYPPHLAWCPCGVHEWREQKRFTGTKKTGKKRVDSLQSLCKYWIYELSGVFGSATGNRTRV